MLAVALGAMSVAGCTGGALREESAGASSSRGSAVKIGFVAPLSGPFASAGEDLRRGFRFYLDRHEGRLGGRKVAVVEVDEGAGPETGVPAVRRLLTRERVVAAAGIVKLRCRPGRAPVVHRRSGSPDHRHRRRQ